MVFLLLGIITIPGWVFFLDPSRCCPLVCSFLFSLFLLSVLVSDPGSDLSGGCWLPSCFLFALN
jgi:hypothetical protein